MGFFDKVKNFFYDEEEVTVKPKVKPEAKKDAVTEPETKPVIPEEEKKKPIEKKDNVEDIISERELFKTEPTFKFPVIFEDEDFVDEKKKNKSINVLDIENTKIKEKIPLGEENKSFTPSPIISPIYGLVENKNDEIISKSNNYLNSHSNRDKRVDFDTVIEKAYGNYQPVPEKEDNKGVFFNLKEEKEDSIDLFKDMKESDKAISRSNRYQEEMDETEEIDIKNKYKPVPPNDDSLKTIDELLESADDQDFYTLVDSMYKDEEKENE